MAQSNNKGTPKKGVATKKKTSRKKVQSKVSTAVDKTKEVAKAELETLPEKVKSSESGAKSETVKSKAAAKSNPESIINADSRASATTKSSDAGGSKERANKQAKTVAPERSVSSEHAPKSGNGIAWLALLFSLGGLAAGGYAYYQSTLNQQSNGAKVNSIDSQIASLATEQQTTTEALSSVGVRIDEVEQGVTQQFSEVTAGLAQNSESVKLLQQQTVTMEQETAPLAEQSKALEQYAMQLQTESAESINALSAQFGETATKWQQQELGSVLSAVERNLAWTGNTTQAAEGLSLLGKQLDDAKYTAVVEQLNTAVTALKQVPVLDINTPYAQLAALSAKVVELPFIQDAALRAQQPKSTSIDSSQAGEEAAQTSSFKAVGKKLFADLSDLVKIQNIDKTPSAKLDSNAKFMMNESVRLNIKAAQLALLSKNESLYQAELNAALAASVEYFDQSAEPVTKWSEEVKALTSLQLNTSIPDISGVKAAFDAVVAGE